MNLETPNITPAYTECLKKMSFLGKIAITTFKLIQNAKAGGVLENSEYLLPDGQNFLPTIHIHTIHISPPFNTHSLIL